MANAWADMNNNLLNLVGLVLAKKQQEKQNARGDLDTLLGLGNQMGVTPGMYEGIQKAAKQAGIQFPDISEFQTKGDVEPQPQQQAPADIMSLLSGLSQTPNSPMGPGQVSAPTPSQQPVNDVQGLAPEEQQILGPAKTYKNFADEVSNEMGVNPDNMIGGEPLKKFRQESFMRYRNYLKDRDSQIKGMMLENRREKRQLTVEDKRWREREALEGSKEKARLKLEAEKERAADERQAQRDAAAERRQSKSISASDRRLEKSLSASDRRLMKTLSAAEKRAYIREKGSDKRLEKREAGTTQRLKMREGYVDTRAGKREANVESRFQRRQEDKKSGLEGITKQKMITIYADDGRTKMVPIPLDKEYAPPVGWSLSKPGKDAALKQMLQPKSQGKVPVYDISGRLLRYE